MKCSIYIYFFTTLFLFIISDELKSQQFTLISDELKSQVTLRDNWKFHKLPKKIEVETHNRDIYDNMRFYHKAIIEFDTLGHIISTYETYDSTGKKNKGQKFEYNKRGDLTYLEQLKDSLVIHQEWYRYDKNYNKIEKEVLEKYIHCINTVTFDKRGKMIREKIVSKRNKHRNKSFTYIYNDKGLLSKKTCFNAMDEIEKTVHFVYDLNSNLTQIFYFDQFEPNKKNISYSYSYDSMNRMLTESHLHTLIETSHYDTIGNKVKEIILKDNETLLTRNYVYDQANNLVEDIEKSPQRILIHKYWYDNRNRAIKKETRLNDKVTREVVIEYDKYNFPIKYFYTKGVYSPSIDEYHYIRDNHENWIRKDYIVRGVLSEITIRKIHYF